MFLGDTNWEHDQHLHFYHGINHNALCIFWSYKAFIKSSSFLQIFSSEANITLKFQTENQMIYLFSQVESLQPNLCSNKYSVYWKEGEVYNFFGISSPW